MPSTGQTAYPVPPSSGATAVVAAVEERSLVPSNGANPLAPVGWVEAPSWSTTPSVVFRHGARMLSRTAVGTGAGTIVTKLNPQATSKVVYCDPGASW